MIKNRILVFASSLHPLIINEHKELQKHLDLVVLSVSAEKIVTAEQRLYRNLLHHGLNNVFLTNNFAKSDNKQIIIELKIEIHFYYSIRIKIRTQPESYLIRT